ncbi:Serine/threonine-protein phosphatase 2A activator 2 [Spathaspora sp. JA1]|nr:Serine/threonine-protein phosphatase 2A activator 2 [Spathaspora sp. JA1]
MTTPVKRITTREDLDKWLESTTFELVLNFITALQESIVGKPNDEPIHESPITSQLLGILDNINTIIDTHPVVHEKDISRFGKVEFREFYDDVTKQSPTLLSPLLDTDDNILELSTYFNESWGDRTRIDYGSGHELNFISFLLCLSQLKIISPQDYPGLLLHVFTKYMKIMRRLQKIYWLEPAGSHGVWGLDDYHFLPFLFGAAQLSTHPYMKPKSIHNPELVEMYKDKYMYMECIDFINNIKTTRNGDKLSIRWHSPMLDDISAAKTWDKIKLGMIKMYKVEVLGKLPIMQHFMFGELIKCPEGISVGGNSVDDCGHVHSRDLVNTWGDCCGIKIPSAIAASEALKQQKTIPFD